MGVAGHLKIQLDEYDQKIRTFVPFYEGMVRLIAGSLSLIRDQNPTIVDLGIGTGALAEACLQARPRAKLIGFDLDPGMIDMATSRLQAHTPVEYHTANFLETDLPPADAFVACISLHHSTTPLNKQRFYKRTFEATNKGGMLVTGDCFPAIEPSLARRHREAWIDHLQQTYSPSEAEGFLQAWSGEDVYFPLDDEISWLRDAGFRPEVMWRQDGFAVVAAFKER